MDSLCLSSKNSRLNYKKLEVYLIACEIPKIYTQNTQQIFKRILKNL